MTLKFKSFGILDLETTGLYNAKITEIALILFERPLSEENGYLPRVTAKFTRCFNPKKTINSIASALTGLDNDVLKNVEPFDKKAVESLRLFMEHLPEPLCLVAHNGDNFDFPILKSEILNSGVTEPFDSVYTVDSIKFFRYTLNKKSIIPDCPALWNPSEDELCLKALYLVEEEIKNKGKLSSSREISQEDNELTPSTKTQTMAWAPKKECKRRKFAGNLTARKKLVFDENPAEDHQISQVSSSAISPVNLTRKPKSFKLEDIYEYFHGYLPIDAHTAESDAFALLECIFKVPEVFFEYADANAVLFNSF